MEQRRGVGNGIMARKHWCGYQRSALVGRVSAARAALYVMYDARPRAPAPRRNTRTRPTSLLQRYSYCSFKKR